MLDKQSTNATSAKIRAMYADMFTIDNYRELMSKKSVPDAAEYLSRHPGFRDAFRETDPNTIHRGYLEELIGRENFETYIRVIKFQGLDKQPFYSFLLRKNEVMTILSAINKINSSLEVTALPELPGYLIKHLGSRVLDIAAAETYSELLQILKGTQYYKVLSKVPLREDGKADFTECELRLRNNYYAGLLEQAEKGFDKSSAEELKSLILKEIDCRNIVNAYRMKAYFGYSADEIKRRSLKFSGIGKRTMDRIYESEDGEQMLELINKTAYGKNSPDTDNIEVKINSVKIRRLRSVLTNSTSAAASVYAFVQLCDIEAANIIRIIEGIRYGVEPAVIESQLVTL